MPCDYSKYPKNWKEIRARILERDEHKCKFCGVPNKAVRVGDHVVAFESADAFYASEDWAAGIGPKPSRIVLTIAHLHDPNPMNCDDDNLAALCQRCHNRLDMPMRQSNARKTRANKVGQEHLC
jgi:5-methylcytosine-specific restriction endonuclease McrA